MTLNPTERDLFLDLAFFFEDRELLGQTLRPVSLASMRAMHHMGLTLMEPEHSLSPVEETREIAAFMWLHTAPIPKVCAAMWDSSWRVVMEEFTEPVPRVLNEFRAWKTRILACIEAADVHVLPRPRPTDDKTPASVIGPTHFAYSVGLIAHFANITPFRARWFLFIGEALQYYHAARWSEGAWTVRKGRETKAADMEDLVPECLKAEMGEPLPA